MKVAAPLLGGIVLVLAGCGSAADDAVSETAAKLGTIRSGELEMALTVSSGGGGAGDVGFELSGPFSLPGEAGELPDAEITYTQLAGTESASATLVSSPGGAVIELDGVEQELPAAALADLEDASAPGSSPAELDIDDWFDDASIEADGQEDGAAIERVEGTLNVPNTVAGLLEIVGELDGGQGATAPALEAASEGLEGEASGRFELRTGAEDRLLRSVSLSLALPLDEDAQRLLSDSGTDAPDRLQINFEMSIARPAQQSVTS